MYILYIYIYTYIYHILPLKPTIKNNLYRGFSSKWKNKKTKTDDFLRQSFASQFFFPQNRHRDLWWSRCHGSQPEVFRNYGQRGRLLGERRISPRRFWIRGWRRLLISALGFFTERPFWGCSIMEYHGTHVIFCDVIVLLCICIIWYYVFIIYLYISNIIIPAMYLYILYIYIYIIGSRVLCCRFELFLWFCQFCHLWCIHNAHHDHPGRWRD